MNCDWAEKKRSKEIELNAHDISLSFIKNHPARIKRSAFALKGVYFSKQKQIFQELGSKSINSCDLSNVDTSFLYQGLRFAEKTNDEH